jgi:hypothetical protein
MKRSLCALTVLFLSVGCTPAIQPKLSEAIAASPSTPSSENLWSSLREGTGYVVLLRHAQTTPGTGDPPGFKLEDCSTQRNLSEAGRTQARQIGQAIRDRKILIAQVFSSQYCRCLETARLLNLGNVSSG